MMLSLWQSGKKPQSSRGHALDLDEIEVVARTKRIEWVEALAWTVYKTDQHQYGESFISIKSALSQLVLMHAFLPHYIYHYQSH